MNASKLASLIFTLTLALAAAPGHTTIGARAAGLTADYPKHPIPGSGSHIRTVEASDDDEPVAIDDVDITNKNIPKDTAVTDNDFLDDAQEYVLSISEEPDNGTAVPKDENLITYTPNFNFSGFDGYQYQICSDDDNENCSEADVTFIVLAFNNPPIAVNDFASMNQSDPLVIDILENDSDPDADALSAVIDAQPANGSVSVNGDNTVTFSPADGFYGLDSFLYHATDGQDSSNQAEVLVEVLQPDLEKPTINWIAPVSNQDVYFVTDEIVVLEVEAFDNEGVDRVEFFRWDAPNLIYMELGIIESPPYRLELDTSTINLGWNQITARAIDLSNNTSDEVYIWLLKAGEIYLPLALHGF